MKYPSVYVVDSQASASPVPPVPPRRRRTCCNAGWVQALLVLLVTIALGGMIFEAFVIYHLHQTQSMPTALHAKIIAEHKATPIRPPGPVKPSKPVAHLTGGDKVDHDKLIMAWNTKGLHVLHEISYKRRSLVIQKEGYYYVYSKVFFVDDGTFDHSVVLRTDKVDESINLLQSRKYVSNLEGKPKSGTKFAEKSNSYLGGVFHLYKDDALVVRVSSTAKILQHKSYENVFGAYML
ncbi:tumor necrosis factor ligand superfamily member 14 [Aulostomus maculatus]